LNTEKAHNLRDKSLEVVRMVRALVGDGKNGKRPYSEFQLELESPAFLTIGVCYEQNGRYSGGAYLSVVNKCEEWSDSRSRTCCRSARSAASVCSSSTSWSTRPCSASSSRASRAVI
jgi:ParB family chromosome partitioning protein